MSEPIEDGWVELRAAGASVSLKSTGPVGHAWPARLRVAAGDVVAERDCDLMNVRDFCDELSFLHEKLKGRTKLESLEGDANLNLIAGGLGAINVEADVSNGFGGPVGYALTVKFQIDQSYLPSLIRGLRVEFLREKS